MKINVNLQIELDPNLWDEEYGNGSKPSQVRKDVQSYVLNAIQCSAGMESSQATVTLR